MKLTGLASESSMLSEVFGYYEQTWIRMTKDTRGDFSDRLLLHDLPVPAPDLSRAPVVGKVVPDPLGQDGAGRQQVDGLR